VREHAAGLGDQAAQAGEQRRERRVERRYDQHGAVGHGGGGGGSRPRAGSRVDVHGTRAAATARAVTRRPRWRTDGYHDRIAGQPEGGGQRRSAGRSAGDGDRPAAQRCPHVGQAQVADVVG
jgi:hypothetical protein